MTLWKQHSINLDMLTVWFQYNMIEYTIQMKDIELTFNIQQFILTTSSKYCVCGSHWWPRWQQRNCIQGSHQPWETILRTVLKTLRWVRALCNSTFRSWCNMALLDTTGIFNRRFCIQLGIVHWSTNKVIEPAYDWNQWLLHLLKVHGMENCSRD